MRVNLDNVVHLDEEEDFATLFEESQKQGEGGTVQEACIIKITNDFVMVDVGEKVEGKFHVDEIKDHNGNLLFKEGDRIKVSVLKGFGENFSVSYKRALRLIKIQEKISELGEDYKDKIINAKIIRKNKGGVILEDSDGVEYFMPKFYALSKEDKGKNIEVCVINVRSDQNSIIVSRRRFLEINQKNLVENIKKLMEKEPPLDGIVKRITSFGIFVAVDDVEGLVHYTEIAHRGPINPFKIYKEGDPVKVKIISFDEEKNRLSFSIRATLEDPWESLIDELKVGYVIRVNVSNIEPYGAFVDVGGGLEGFLHISEISWSKDTKHPGDILSVGQEISVEIIEINKENRRLRVSLKKLLERPFSKFIKSHKEGDVLEGRVSTITDFGAFINLGDLDGLLRNEEVSWDKSKRCKDILTVGQTLRVKLIKTDSEAQRVSLSLKALEESPVDIFAKTYSVDSVIEGEVTDIKNFGVFVNVDGVDILIRNEDLSSDISKQEIQKGSKIKASVSFIDTANQRIRASMRRLDYQKEREEVKNFNSNDKMTLGDKLRGQL